VADKNPMRWDKWRGNRWYKMVDGKRIYCRCREDLRLPPEQCTEQGSREAMRRWWVALQATKYRVSGSSGAPLAPDICGHLATYEAFLRTRIRPKSFANIQKFTAELAGFLPGKNIGSEVVTAYYHELSERELSQESRKKRLNFFRGFIRYLYQEEAIEDLPRNLDKYQIKVPQPKIKEFDTNMVVAMLNSLTNRHRLYCLLVLNCGMQNQDIAALTKRQVDLEGGTLRYKRKKTEQHKNVPEHQFKLWPNTLALMKELESSHPVLFLTTKRGTSLCTSVFKDGCSSIKDMISAQRKRLPPQYMTLKDLRTFGATLVGRHPSFAHYRIHYLEHAPENLADRHYVAFSQEVFDEVIMWLYRSVFDAV